MVVRMRLEKVAAQVGAHKSVVDLRDIYNVVNLQVSWLRPTGEALSCRLKDSLFEVTSGLVDGSGGFADVD